MHLSEIWFSAQVTLAAAFLIAAAVVVVSGIKLSLYADALGTRTGLGNGFAGLIFLAGVTSLPELAVSFTAAFNASRAAAGIVNAAERILVLRGGSDLALGNVIGSNSFNLLILVLLDCLYRKGSLFRVLQNDHARSAGSALVLIILLAAGLAAEPGCAAVVPWLGTGLFTPVLAVVCLFLLYRVSKEPGAENETRSVLPREQSLCRIPAAQFYCRLILLAGLIVFSGAVLSLLGARMALPFDQGGFGLQESFIGSVFLAVCTSLPELTVSVSCVRMGFFDLAAGNVLGSNMFNMLILFIADAGLRTESILRCAGTSNRISLAALILMTLMTIWALRHKPEKCVFGISCVSLLILAVYLLAAGFVF